MAMYLDSRQGPRLMPMDLSKTGDSYVLSADLPGIDPSTVDIDVDGQLLSIRAERPAPSTEGVPICQAPALSAGVKSRDMSNWRFLSLPHHPAIPGRSPWWPSWTYRPPTAPGPPFRYL